MGRGIPSQAPRTAPPQYPTRAPDLHSRWVGWHPPDTPTRLTPCAISTCDPMSDNVHYVTSQGTCVPRGAPASHGPSGTPGVRCDIVTPEGANPLLTHPKFSNSTYWQYVRLCYILRMDQGMDENERSRLLRIRLKAKRGTGVLADGEMEFCLAMLAKDPSGYEDVGREVRDEVRRDFSPGR